MTIAKYALAALVVVVTGAATVAAETSASATGTGAQGTSARTTGLAAKMSDGTKRFTSSTKGLLTPKRKKTAANAGPVPRTSRNEKPGFFKSWFEPEPPPPPRTIKEWMSLKQVRP